MKRVVIEEQEDLRELGEVDKGPVLFVVRREFYDAVDHYLRSKRVIVSLEDVSKEYISLKAVHPRFVYRASRHLQHNSHKMADMRVLEAAFRVSKFSEMKSFSDPLEFFYYLSSTCRKGYKFVFAVSRRVPTKVYILCGGVEGAVLAAVGEDPTIVLGEEALNTVALRLPLDVVVYSISLEALRKAISELA